MEKIEADIFNILHNTKIRLQGDAEDNYGFMGKGYAEKLAVEIVKEIQPSEKKALSVEDIKSIAIKATRKIKYPDGKTEYSLWLSNDEWTTIAQAIFDALPTQKALSVESIEEILLTKYGQYLLVENAKQLAQAIHSALPAQREVRYPEKRYSCKTCNGVGWWAEQVGDTEQEQRKCPDCYSGETPQDMEYNDAIDEFKKLNGG